MLQVAVDDLKQVDSHIKNMKSYSIKPSTAPGQGASATPIGPFTLSQYKRYVQWFKENMLEGLEAPPAPPLDLAQAKDDLKKDMKNFFSQDHDFSITLIAK